MSTPLLLTGIRLRELDIRNRVVVSPMCQYQGVDGEVQEWHFAHHARFALGGVGAAFVEATAITAEGRITHGCLGLWSDRQVPGLKRIADLYRAYGVVPGIQIGHAGRRGSSARPWDGAAPLKTGGQEAPWRTMAPSAIPERQGYPVPIEMTEMDIEGVAASFRAAFVRALAAGFDILEIHGAHGYLLHSFFSPRSNQRSDRFGGSLDGRMRLPLMVAEIARTVWPARLPVFYRMSVVDGIAEGLKIEESIALAKALKNSGIDVIDCSSGGMSGPATLSTATITPGYQVPLSEAIRNGSGIATMAVGAILDGPQAEMILQSGKADLIAIGREMMVDPNWCLRAAEALGVEQPYSVLPKYYSFYLERRARVLARDATV